MFLISVLDCSSTSAGPSLGEHLRTHPQQRAVAEVLTFLVEGHYALGNSLPDGCTTRTLSASTLGCLWATAAMTLTVGLRHVASAPHAQADVHILEALLAQQQQGLLDLIPHRLWLQVV